MASQKTGRIRNERVNLILTAATEEFANHGFRGATLQGIADLAGLPKANVLYYFKSKRELYETVLEGILDLWNRELDDITADDNPADALERYIRSKIEVSRKYPTACRIFAAEIISGGQQLSNAKKNDTRRWVEERVAVIQAWIDEGSIKPINPMNLLFLIWGATQHYADYEYQICSILKRKKLSKKLYEQAADTTCDIVLRGCGLID